MDYSRLAEVRRLLHEAPEFSTVWDYFLTHFGENPEFMKLGEPIRDEDFIQQVVAQVCRSLFQQPMLLIRSQLIRLPDQQFIHGTMFLGERLASILYFEDIHKGMMAVLWSDDPPETKYVRFTGRALYEGLNRSSN